jgi:hypothetical protein
VCVGAKLQSSFFSAFFSKQKTKRALHGVLQHFKRLMMKTGVMSTEENGKTCAPIVAQQMCTPIVAP